MRRSLGLRVRWLRSGGVRQMRRLRVLVRAHCVGGRGSGGAGARVRAGVDAVALLRLHAGGAVQQQRRVVLLLLLLLRRALDSSFSNKRSLEAMCSALPSPRTPFR